MFLYTRDEVRREVNLDLNITPVGSTCRSSTGESCSIGGHNVEQDLVEAQSIGAAVISWKTTLERSAAFALLNEFGYNCFGLLRSVSQMY